MEFHAGGSSQSGDEHTVEVMCCTDELCRQIKVTVQKAELGGQSPEDVVVKALQFAHEKLGDGALKIKTVAEVKALGFK